VETPGAGITVTVNHQLPTVISGAASGITKREAILNGTVNDNGAATNYYFEYGTTTGYGSTTATGSLTAGSGPVPLTAALTGLTPGSIYHFRVYAENFNGISYGNDAVFTTDAELNLGTTGKGAGSVVADAPGYAAISCSSASPGTCEQGVYKAGTVVSLTAVPDWKSSAVDWNGADSGAGKQASVAMAGNRSVSVQFGLNPLVNLQPTGVEYALIQEAYKAAPASGGRIQAQALEFLEFLEFSDDAIADITLSGGVVGEYGTLPGYSAVRGLTIRSGKVVVENIKVGP
jgi:hypothetical protein